jgi:hypothetical protein
MYSEIKELAATLKHSTTDISNTTRRISMKVFNSLEKSFNMQTANDKNFERTAYHESGHIVITYLSGYTCDSVELLTSEPGTGKTTMNYQDDLMLVASITNVTTYSEFFNELTSDVKRQSPGVARITSILLAGSVAECTYLNGGKVDGNMEVELSGPDLIRVDNVHFFLSQINTDHDPNYIQDNVQKVLMIMSIPDVWKTIENLAKAIMTKTNKRLDKTEIEAILTTSGYLNYIKTL